MCLTPTALSRASSHPCPLAMEHARTCRVSELLGMQGGSGQRRDLHSSPAFASSIRFGLSLCPRLTGAPRLTCWGYGIPAAEEPLGAVGGLVCEHRGIYRDSRAAGRDWLGFSTSHCLTAVSHTRNGTVSRGIGCSAVSACFTRQALLPMMRTFTYPAVSPCVGYRGRWKHAERNASEKSPSPNRVAPAGSRCEGICSAEAPIALLVAGLRMPCTASTYRTRMSGACSSFMLSTDAACLCDTKRKPCKI